MKIVFVYNPRSGSAMTRHQLQELFKKHTLEIEEMIALDKGAWHKKLTPFIKKGATIAVYGGDGTLSAVAQLLVGTKAILAPLPGGTMNHFTKDLRIPQALDQALEHLKVASIRKIDVAKVNKRLFINNASIGLYPLSLRQRDRLEGRLGKWPAALLAATKAFIRFRLYNVTINNESFKTPFVFVGNNVYKLAGVKGVKRQTINQGVLSVYSIRVSSRFAFVKIIVAGFFKRARYFDEFRMYEVKELTVEMKQPQLYVSYDGEVGRLKSPLQFAILKGALRLRY